MVEIKSSNGTLYEIVYDVEDGYAIDVTNGPRAEDTVCVPLSIIIELMKRIGIKVDGSHAQVPFS